MMSSMEISKQIIVNYCRKNERERKRRQLQNIKKLRLIIRKHQQTVKMYCEAMHSIIYNFRPRERLLWAHLRSKDVWENLYANLDERRWCKEFRVNRGQFDYICNELRNEFKPKFNPVSDKNFVRVKTKVAITLYKLKSCAEYQVIGNIFGLQKSTIHFIFYEVIEATVKILTPKWIKMPNLEEAQQISSNFISISKISQILGAIDGTHIPIKAPLEGNRDLLNRIGWTSIILQAVVDDHCSFRDISCKFPGSAHDALALKGSFIYQNEASIFPEYEYYINNTTIPYFLIGDPAYPLLPWIMKDFPGQNLDAMHFMFNKSINRACVKVEQAFGMLKNKWRMLLKKSDINYEFVPKVVAASCTFHNFALNDDLSLQNSNDTLENDGILQQPDTVASRFPDSATGINIRNLLFEEFCRESL